MKHVRMLSLPYLSKLVFFSRVANDTRRDSSRRGITGCSSRTPRNDEYMGGEGVVAAVVGVYSKGEVNQRGGCVHLASPCDAFCSGVAWRQRTNFDIVRPRRWPLPVACCHRSFFRRRSLLAAADYVYVLSTLNRYFCPSTSSTTSIRADSSILSAEM